MMMEEGLVHCGDAVHVLEVLGSIREKTEQVLVEQPGRNTCPWPLQQPMPPGLLTSFNDEQ